MTKNVEIEESSAFGGYWNLVGTRRKVQEEIAELSEELKNLKKQLKGLNNQLADKEHDIVEEVKEKKEIHGIVRLEDFFPEDVK